MSRFSRPSNPLGCFTIVFFIMFGLVVIGMVAGGIWNYSLYRECITDGKKAYQCKAMLDGNSRYIAVDDVSEK